MTDPAEQPDPPPAAQQPPRTELVTLQEAKAHLRVMHEFEDADITLKLRAAEEMAVVYLDRAVYPSKELMDALSGRSAGQRADAGARSGRGQPHALPARGRRAGRRGADRDLDELFQGARRRGKRPGDRA